MDFKDIKIAARNHILAITAINPTLALPGIFVSEKARNAGLGSLIETLDFSSASSARQVFEIIVVLAIYLAEDHESDHKKLDRDAISSLREWIAEAILPTEAFAEPSSSSIEWKETLTSDEIAVFRAMSLSGLLLLARLQIIKPIWEDKHVPTILTCLASFTDLNDVWTCSTARDHAYSLLEECAAFENVPTSLTAVLQERIKPLFAKTSNPAVSQQSRKATGLLPNAATAYNDINGEVKYWKYRDPYSVTVFQWVLKRLDVSSVRANWPLIIAPILTLIDDTSIKYKVKGCISLAVFLKKYTSLLLEETGLGEIFETAVMPCLLYLPSLTEEGESLEMLKAAYPTLISLALVRFSGGKRQASKNKALDKILRNGVLKGYSQAEQHTRIGELLVNEITVLVKELGIECVKHLKHILPLLSGVMGAPFATAYPPLLQAAVMAVQTIIVAGWTQIDYYRGEILKSMMICWCRIEDEKPKSQELKAVQESIGQAAQLLTCATIENAKAVEEYQTLINSDNRLQDLLPVLNPEANPPTHLTVPSYLITTGRERKSNANATTAQWQRLTSLRGC